MGWTEFYERAVHGIVDLRMGRAAGLDDNTVRRRARTDGWAPEHPGAWRLPTHPDTTRARVAAAVRRAGDLAVVDRHTSFALRGLVSAFPTRHQLLLPHGRRRRSLDGLDVRRTRVLDPTEDVEEIEGLPVVTVARGLVNSARDLRTDAILRVALAAQRQGMLDLDGLQDALDHLPFAPGRRRVAQVLQQLALDGSESGFEFTTRQRITAAGLVPDPGQPVVLVGGVRRRIDIAWAALRVGIECQGYRDHTGADALDRDVTRLNDLTAEGDWLILQVTATILHERWDDFVDALCRCLRRRAEALGLPHPAGTTRGH